MQSAGTGVNHLSVASAFSRSSARSRQSSSQIGKVEEGMFSGLSSAQVDQLRASLLALHAELWTRPY